jgi:hypothetical protein
VHVARPIAKYIPRPSVDWLATATMKTARVGRDPGAVSLDAKNFQRPVFARALRNDRPRRPTPKTFSATSVGRSVSWLVGRLVGWLVGRKFFRTAMDGAAQNSTRPPRKKSTGLFAAALKFSASSSQSRRRRRHPKIQRLKLFLGEAARAVAHKAMVRARRNSWRFSVDTRSSAYLTASRSTGAATAAATALSVATRQRQGFGHGS